MSKDRKVTDCICISLDNGGRVAFLEDKEGGVIEVRRSVMPSSECPWARNEICRLRNVDIKGKSPIEVKPQ